MEKRIKINSIDLDYFGNRGFPDTITNDLIPNIENLLNYIIRCSQNGTPVYISNGHGDIIEVIRDFLAKEPKNLKTNFDITNFDFHDDLQEIENMDSAEVMDILEITYDASWVDYLLLNYPNSSYTWIYPSNDICIKEGEGMCNRFRKEDVLSVEDGEKNILYNMKNRYKNITFNSYQGELSNLKSLEPSDISFIAISEEYTLSRVLETLVQRVFANPSLYNCHRNINELVIYCLKALNFRNGMVDTSSAFFAIDGFSKGGSSLNKEFYKELPKYCKENNYVIEAFDYLRPQLGFKNVAFIENTKDGWFTPQSMIYNYILSEFSSDDYFYMRSLMFRLIDPINLVILASFNAQNINFYETEFKEHDWSYIFQKLQ